MTNEFLKKEIEEVEKEIEILEDDCYGFEKVHIENLINPFLEKWTGTMYGHLVDTDENDGQRLRVNIYMNELKERLKTLKECQDKFKKHFSEFIREVDDEIDMKILPYQTDLETENTEVPFLEKAIIRNLNEVKSEIIDKLAKEEIGGLAN